MLQTSPPFSPWMVQAGITNSMLQDIIANYRQGGTVRDLANFYTQCLAFGESGGGLTKSLLFVLTCSFGFLLNKWFLR